MSTWSTSSGYNIIQVLSGRSNVFLLSYLKTNILVDTGPGFMWKTLVRRLETLNIKKIDLLILTHSHFDHAANSAKIKVKYSARVIIHRAETSYLNTGDNIVPGGTNSLTSFIVKIFSGIFKKIARYQPCMNDLTVDERFDLSGFGINAFLIHTPGHTPGSTSLVIENEIALVGDTMFGVFPWSVFPPYAVDTHEMLKSWKKLLDTNCKIFIPSHGSTDRRSLVEKNYKKKQNST